MVCFSRAENRGAVVCFFSGEQFFSFQHKRRRAVGVFWSRKIGSGFSFREQFFCSRREAVLFLCSVVFVQEK